MIELVDKLIELFDVKFGEKYGVFINGMGVILFME